MPCLLCSCKLSAFWPAWGVVGRSCWRMLGRLLHKKGDKKAKQAKREQDMGCASSQPATSNTNHGTGGSRAGQAQRKPAAAADPGVPDAGLTDTHTYIKFLGRGGTGDAHLYEDKADGERVAIKLMKRPLPKVIMPNILREIKIQADLGEGHVNIIEAKEVMLTEHHLALSMEYAACGSLTGYVAERWQDAQRTGLFLGENEARYFFRQFVDAVSYCHEHNVAHRDLKLDNTLMSDDKPPRIKLCDFGFAKEWQSDAQMFTHIGTPVYMAPEVINTSNKEKGYNAQMVDVWASGVLLIVMLLGQFPFDHLQNPDPNSSEAHLEVWMQQVKGPWSDIPSIKQASQALSNECMDLLNKIFVIDELKRITLKGIREHAWYNKPLEAKYRDAFDRFQQEQGEKDHYTATRRLSEELLKQRGKQLALMVEQAAQRPSPTGRHTPLVRIDLRESSVLENPTGENLGDIREDAEYTNGAL